ncbi:MAG: hypothetical protein ACRED5_19235 [Propylenella sp.]
MRVVRFMEAIPFMIAFALVFLVLLTARSTGRLPAPGLVPTPKLVPAPIKRASGRDVSGAR